jgi:flagellar biosynthesis protein FliQ
MTEEFITKMIYDALLMILKLSMPTLIVGLLVGVIVGILQATTQIQEMTLSFIPKMIAVFLVILIMGQWMLKSLIEYTVELIRYIPNLK